MPIPAPQLDDRDFRQLMTEAEQLIRTRCPEWTDLSPNDPGTVLLETFAHLTEVLLYRCNRVPDKIHVSLLNLLGLKLLPPAAARAELTFTRRDATQPRIIPKGCAVSGEAVGADPVPVFVTAHAVKFEAGQTEAKARAYHAERVTEVLGISSGRPGQVFTVRRPPLVEAFEGDLRLMVGVEITQEELGHKQQGAVRWHEQDGVKKNYLVWEEVPHFAELQPLHAYRVDYAEGTIAFSPALMLAPRRPAAREKHGTNIPSAREAWAAVPPAGREIRIWYFKGGGRKGNLRAGILTKIKDEIPGIKVTNLQPSIGGEDAETPADAILRGPNALFLTDSLVTSGDYERAVLRQFSERIAGARVFARRDLWPSAAPGLIDLILVPRLPDVLAGSLTAGSQLQALREQQALDTELPAAIREHLLPQACLGAQLEAGWARYKPVKIHATLRLQSGADPEDAERRLQQALQLRIDPCSGAARAVTPWSGFGRPLPVSEIQEIIRAEPDVAWCESLQIEVVDTPDKDVTALAADPQRPRLWYAGTAEGLYRSLDDGAGWMRLPTTGAPGNAGATEKIAFIEPHPVTPGWLAVASILTYNGGQQGFRVRLSATHGEQWTMVHDFSRTEGDSWEVTNLTWIPSGGQPVLLIATDRGLFRLHGGEGPVLKGLRLLPEGGDERCYALDSVIDQTGRAWLAAALRNDRGQSRIFVSNGPDFLSFSEIATFPERAYQLRFEPAGPSTYLWVGLHVAPGDKPGGVRIEVGTDNAELEKWNAGWAGGDCTALTIAGGTVFSGSARGGVLLAHPQSAGPDSSAWQTTSGLPVGTANEIVEVSSVASRTDSEGCVVLAGTPVGIFRFTGQAANQRVEFSPVSIRFFTHGAVSLEPTCLFVSEQPNLNILEEENDETE